MAGTTTLVTEKSKAVAALGVERMKDTIGVRLGWRNGDQAADAIALDLAEDLAIALNSRRRLPDRRTRRRPPEPLGDLTAGAPTAGQASSR